MTCCISIGWNPRTADGVVKKVLGSSPGLMEPESLCTELPLFSNWEIFFLIIFLSLALRFWNQIFTWNTKCFILNGYFPECSQQWRLVLQGPFMDSSSFEPHGKFLKYTHFTGSKKLWLIEGRCFARNETEMIKSGNVNSECNSLASSATQVEMIT